MDTFVDAANQLAETIAKTGRIAEDTVTVLASARQGPALWPQPARGVMSLAEAADRTGRHVDVLRRWCAQGRIPATRVGRTWAISRDVVAELANHRSRSRPRLTNGAAAAADATSGRAGR
jgi:excisionase family DNA binding protein